MFARTMTPVMGAAMQKEELVAKWRATAGAFRFSPLDGYGASLP